MAEEENVCKESTFEGLFQKLSKSIRDFLYFKCGDLSISEDIVQDAFFKLWEKCKDVKPEKAKSFLFTVANNLFLNLAEKQKVRLNYKNKVLPTVNKEDPLFIVEMNEHKERLENAINALPDGQREAFLMNRIEKMSYADIAVALGVSQKAVEKRMHKALLKLKDLLKPKK